MKVQKDELVQLRSIKIENETKISFLDERLLYLKYEVEIKLNTISEQDKKLQTQSDLIDKREQQIKDYDQQINSLRLIKEADHAMIEGLQSEKTHLELALAENKKLKDQYFKKSEEVQNNYSTLFREINAIQKDKVEIDEIKKDRDERIDALRIELENLTNVYDDLCKENSALIVNCKNQKEELDRYEFDHTKLAANLNIANNVR